MIISLQHSANWTSCAVIMVAVLPNHCFVTATMIALMGVMNLSYATVQAILIWQHLNMCAMAIGTVKTSRMRIQMFASARRKTSSVRGSILCIFMILSRSLSASLFMIICINKSSHHLTWEEISWCFIFVIHSDYMCKFIY
jgi:hypothetical protein